MKQKWRMGILLVMGLIAFHANADDDLPSPGATSMEDYGYVEAKSQPLPLPLTTPHAPKRLSLKEAILLALRNNPDVESAELTRVTDKFALEVAHYNFLPHFTIGSTGTYANGARPVYAATAGMTLNTAIGTTITANYSNAFTGNNGSNLNFLITQPLLNGAGWTFATNTLATAVEQEAVAKLNFKNSVITGVVNVITAYRALVQDYNNLEIQKLTLLRSKQTVDQFKLREKAGKISQSDVIQQEATYETTKVSMMQQQSSLYSDYQNFLQALGLVPTAQVLIDKNIEVSHFKIPDLNKSIQLALANNIDYQSAIINLRATERGVLTAENQARWTLNATVAGGIGTSGATGAAAATSGPTVGFSLSIPIYNLPARQTVVQAKISLEKAKISLEGTKLQLMRDITNQINQLRNQYQQVLIAENAVKLQQQTLDSARIKLQYGKTTVFEVNQLQDQLLQSQTNLVGDKIQFLNQITTLDQKLGITLDVWGITLRY